MQSMIPPKRFVIFPHWLGDAQKVWARSDFSSNNVCLLSGVLSVTSPTQGASGELLDLFSHVKDIPSARDLNVGHRVQQN